MNFIDIANASTETTELAVTSEKAPEGLLNSLGIHGTDIAFQFVNFIIVSLVIWFLILKPITKKMTERQKLIDDSLKNADEIEKRLNKSQIEYQEKIDQAKIEARKIIEKATEEAVESKERLKKEATAEIEELVQKARSAIELERRRQMNQLRKETVFVVFSALENVLSKKITKELDQSFIEEVLKEVR